MNRPVPPLDRCRRRSAFALIVILGAMVLLTMLIVGLLAYTSTESGMAYGYQSSFRARLLGDSAVNLAQGQIYRATHQGAGIAWTSQPGLARTFDRQGRSQNAYKLYSAPDMVLGDPDNTSSPLADTTFRDSLALDKPGEDWNTLPAIWTDLNYPVQGENGLQYPIVDPRATAEGFSVASMPGQTAYQALPMPVRWLYVLKDGSYVAPTVGTGGDAVVAGASKSNPIVGRVAFWTDDDSCKLNINTCGEGAYWDTPRANTSYERDDLAQYQPANGEFQRYPGHPAMTSLSVVFPSLGPQEIFNLLPRLKYGGSEGGQTVAAQPLTGDTDRLYASVDELMFNPQRDANGSLGLAEIERSRFFLTAHSRAPETNLFGLPRVAVWPVDQGLRPNRTNAFDRLIALASTINNRPYYFQRAASHSVSADISIADNRELYAYLEALTGSEIPAFGGSFAGKYGNDRDQILTEIFDYIRSTNLYDDTLPEGNQFTDGRDPTYNTKGLPGNGWVAPTRYTSPNGVDTMGFGRYYTLSEAGIGLICNAVADDPATTTVDESSYSNDPAKNQVLGGVPLDPGEKMIQGIFVMEFFTPMLGWMGMRPNMRVEVDGLDTLEVTSGGVTAKLFPGLSTGSVIYDEASQGMNGGRYWGGNPGWRYFGYGKGSPARGALPADVGPLYPFIGVPVRLKAPATGGKMDFSGGKVDVRLYDNASGDLMQTVHLNFPASNATTAGFPLPELVTVGTDIFTGAKATTKEHWWAFNLNGTWGGSGRLATIHKKAWANKTFLEGTFFREGFDVVRTLMPEHGDYRLVAASPQVKDDVFQPHPFYQDPAQLMASNLGNSDFSNSTPGYDHRGYYIEELKDKYPDDISPDISANATATQRPEATGDFDNGLPQTMDGPYVNKPDEGNSNSAGIPYFDDYTNQVLAGPTYFSPNRQVASAGVFGSLPTGIKSGVPWRTLLFRPQPTHFGASSPADHLLLDLFWMPVVQPYAISDRFSTAGKINMNYYIYPFTYIRRATGLYGLLKSERMGSIPNSAVNKYKHIFSDLQFRLPINIEATLSQFDTRFADDGVFRSASEICDIDMVPQGETLGAMATYWQSHALTGDNLRERIYTTLYPRLTTRSNTFTVHYRAQALQKTASTPANVWREDVDRVAGENAGSTVIERFINPQNAAIPDYPAQPQQLAKLAPVDEFYQWRVLAHRRLTQ